MNLLNIITSVSHQKYSGSLTDKDEKYCRSEDHYRSFENLLELFIDSISSNRVSLSHLERT